MKNKSCNKIAKVFLAFLCLSTALVGQDWPIYKGNLYFTGNNDEIAVRGNKIRFVFRAKAKIVNPIVSAGRIYFLDLRKNVYSIDEETGKLYWMLNLKKVSQQFVTSKRSFGKPKYPIIKGDHLFLSDSSVIYCLNKKTGKVLWARTGMRNETKLGRHSIARVDGIFADPMINGDNVHYGTRSVFMARDMKTGHLKWKNDKIKSYSAFPTYYDKYIFTQSVVHAKKQYTIYCLNKENGVIIWQKTMPLPFKIFAPVVYKDKVFIANGKGMYALNLKDGAIVWQKEYDNFLTSNPSFTDREILFSIGNQDVLIVNPQNGEIISRKKTAKPSSPKFVTIRDQLYIASAEKKNYKGRQTTFTRLDTHTFEGDKPLWNFEAPMPGGPSQPVAAGGVLFLPAGQFLYALGKDAKTNKTGDDYLQSLKNNNSDSSTNSNENNDTEDGRENQDLKIDLFDQDLIEDKTDENKIVDKIIDDKTKVPPVKNNDTNSSDTKNKIPLKKVKIIIADKNGTAIPAAVEVVKKHKGEIVYRKKYQITKKNTEIDVPNDDDVEIITDSKGYLPNKTIIGKKEKKVNVTLTSIQKGEKLSLNSIHFRSGKAYLKAGSLNILKRMARVLLNQPGIKLLIQGHTDSQGSKKYNQTLSEKRAEAVRDFLIKQGVSPARINTRGFGESKPIASNKSAAGRRKNRRTEFVILEK